MNNTLFEDYMNLDLEMISNKINQYIDKHFDSFNDKDTIEKWNSFPILFVKSEKIQNKYLELVQYIDELDLDVKVKISLIITLASLIVIGKVKIIRQDINNVYLLTTFMNDVMISDYNTKLKIFNDNKLLDTIRYKSLDCMERIFILNYIKAKSLDLDLSNEEEIKKYRDKMIDLIKKTDYYKLSNDIGYYKYEEENKK